MKSEFRIDKTYLSLDNAEERGFIHRDYIAHCLRWSHVIKKLQEKQCYKTAHILDVGCGREIPLAKMLYSSKMSPLSYTGVDMGPVPLPDFIEKMAAKFDLEIYDHHDIVNTPLIKTYTHITCFEVLEHMPKKHGIEMLGKLRQLMDKGSTLFLSTPCYNGSQANNHVYEWTYNELKNALEALFKITGSWGTFASIKDYEPFLVNYHLNHAFEKLREYYDVNYLATIFAPLFPYASRNCLWEMTIKVV